MSSLFVLLVVLGVLPLILMRPLVGVLAWAWLSYMTPHKLVYGFATTMPFLDLVAICTAIALILNRDRKQAPIHALLVPLAIYVVWFSLTTAMSQSFELSIEKYSNSLKAVLLALLVPVVTYSRFRMTAVVLSIAGSLGYFGLKGGLFTLATGGQFQVLGAPGTFLGDRNDLALALAMTIPLWRFVQLHPVRMGFISPKLMSLFAIFMMVMTAVAVVGSQSRGGFLTLGALSLWLILLSRRRILLLLTVGALGAAILNFMPDTWHNRMETIESYDQDASARSRMQMWRYGIELADDYPLGIGFRAFRMRNVAADYLPEGIRMRASHSIYFEVLGEHGYIGLFLYLFMNAATYFTCSEVKRQAKQLRMTWAYDLATMVQIMLVSFAVGGALLEVASFDLAYQMIGIAMALHLIVRQRLAGQPATAAPPALPDPKSPVATPTA